jgi:hypothetical protein
MISVSRLLIPAWLCGSRVNLFGSTPFTYQYVVVSTAAPNVGRLASAGTCFTSTLVPASTKRVSWIDAPHIRAFTNLYESGPATGYVNCFVTNP